MVRVTLTTILVFGAVTLLHAGSVRGGECYDPNGFCTEPCPAENNCYPGSDCPEGMMCDVWTRCYPRTCDCTPDGRWDCPWWLCAGECVERPVWNGPPSYVIIGLGTLGGWSSVALAVNDCGQVVGGADTREGLRHAFLWNAGEMIDLGALPGIRHSEAWDVNNNAQAVGIAQDYWGGPERAFLWEDGQMIDLGDLGGGQTDANAINDAGQVVGRSYVSLSRSHAFLWEQGVMTDLTDTIGLGGGANDINNLGHVAAWVSTGTEAHAALWNGVAVIDLGTLGGQYAAATAVNDFGQIVGASERAPGGDAMFHAFLWDGGNMIDLGAIGGFAASLAVGINNGGQVLGSPSFLYDPDKGMQDYMELLPPEDRRYVLLPRDINDAGQIVGQGFRGGGAFLMTPLNGDFDADDDTDLVDFAAFCSCMTGPGAAVEGQCKPYDVDRDGDIDLRDVRAFEWVFTGP